MITIFYPSIKGYIKNNLDCNWKIKVLDRLKISLKKIPNKYIIYIKSYIMLSIKEFCFYNDDIVSLNNLKFILDITTDFMNIL